MTVVTKTIITLSEDERKTLKNAQDILDEICSSSLTCEGCPLNPLCDTKFSITNTLNNLMDLLN